MQSSGRCPAPHCKAPINATNKYSWELLDCAYGCGIHFDCIKNTTLPEDACYEHYCASCRLEFTPNDVRSRLAPGCLCYVHRNDSCPYEYLHQQETVYPLAPSPPVSGKPTPVNQWYQDMNTMAQTAKSMVVTSLQPPADAMNKPMVCVRCGYPTLLACPYTSDLTLATAVRSLFNSPSSSVAIASPTSQPIDRSTTVHLPAGLMSSSSSSPLPPSPSSLPVPVPRQIPLTGLTHTDLAGRLRGQLPTLPPGHKHWTDEVRTQLIGWCASLLTESQRTTHYSGIGALLQRMCHPTTDLTTEFIGQILDLYARAADPRAKGVWCIPSSLIWGESALEHWTSPRLLRYLCREWLRPFTKETDHSLNFPTYFLRQGLSWHQCAERLGAAWYTTDETWSSAEIHLRTHWLKDIDRGTSHRLALGTYGLCTLLHKAHVGPAGFVSARRPVSQGGFGLTMDAYMRSHLGIRPLCLAFSLPMSRFHFQIPGFREFYGNTDALVNYYRNLFHHAPPVPMHGDPDGMKTWNMWLVHDLTALGMDECFIQGFVHRVNSTLTVP